MKIRKAEAGDIPETMTGIALQRATREDSEFAFVVKKTALGDYVAKTHGWNEEEQRALHARRFDPALTQIIRLHDQPIGLLTVHQGVDCVQLRQLFILPTFQNQGIGRQIARKLLAECDAKDMPITLQVLKTNNRARTFYERLGFAIVGETDTHHQMKRKSQQSAGCWLAARPSVIQKTMTASR